MGKRKEPPFTTGFVDLEDTLKANIDAHVEAATRREQGKLNGDPKLQAAGERDIAVAKSMGDTLHRLREAGKAVKDPAVAHKNPTHASSDFRPKITLTRDTKKFKLDKKERNIDQNKGWRKL